MRRATWTRATSAPPPSAPEPPESAPQPPPAGVPGEYVHTPAPGTWQQYGVPQSSKATLSLVLGLVGMLLCFPGILCGCLVIVQPVLGFFAWDLGRKELRAIDAGMLPPDGRGSAQAGTILGIIAMALAAIRFLWWIAALVFRLALPSIFSTQPF